MKSQLTPKPGLYEQNGEEHIAADYGHRHLFGHHHHARFGTAETDGDRHCRAGKPNQSR